VATIFLALLVVVFLGMGATVMTVVQGEPSARAGATTLRDDISTVGPSLGLLALVLILGLYVPAPLDALLHNAASSLGAPQ
jgi:hydrogenase-4 component F